MYSQYQRGILDGGNIKYKKGGQVDTTLLYIWCRVGHCNGCVKLELNDIIKTLNTKNDSVGLYYYLQWRPLEGKERDIFSYIMFLLF